MSSAENLQNVFSNYLPLLVVAAGQTVVMITGGIDLSVTGIIGLASICGSLVMTGRHDAFSLAAGLGIMLGIGIFIGLLNGLAVAKLDIPPFILTLTSMMFFGGLAVWITRSRNIGLLPTAFTAIGRELAGALIITVGTGLGAHLLLRRSVMGQWLYAIGSNSRAARVSGVPVAPVIVLAYMASGLSAAAASVLYTSRLETGSPVIGQRILLDVIGAVVIGGTSLFGGRGSVLWTAAGVLFMTVIDNSLNLLGLSNFSVLMAKGFVILIAALLDRARTRYADV
jgi:ribose transport system permease protein